MGVLKSMVDLLLIWITLLLQQILFLETEVGFLLVQVGQIFRMFLLDTIMQLEVEDPFMQQQDL